MNFLEIAAYLFTALLALALCFLFRRTVKTVIFMIFQSVLGGLGLYICNLLLSGTGFYIGLNIVTASVCGLFGLPGLFLLIILKFFY
ncbi:MAG: transcriptional regulator [Ruminococcaceae bacterium]|nr:transcriptional regulator [Oscillospiraceae bacterium]